MDRIDKFLKKHRLITSAFNNPLGQILLAKTDWAEKLYDMADDRGWGKKKRRVAKKKKGKK